MTGMMRGLSLGLAYATESRHNLISLSEEELQVYLASAKSRVNQLLSIQENALGARGWELCRTKDGVRLYKSDLPNRSGTTATKAVTTVKSSVLEMYNLLATPTTAQYQDLMGLLYPELAMGTILWSSWIPNEQFGAEDLFIIGHAVFKAGSSQQADRDFVVMSLLTMVRQDDGEAVGVMVMESIDRDEGCAVLRKGKQKTTRLLLSKSGFTFKKAKNHGHLLVQHVTHIYLQNYAHDARVNTRLSTAFRHSQSVALENLGHYFEAKRRIGSVTLDGNFSPSDYHEHIYHPPRKFRCVSSHWLYNRLQIQGGMILIDARPHVSYEAAIKGAIHIPPMNANSTEDIVHNLTPEAKSVFSRRRLLEIVVYDLLGDLEITPDSWSYKLCAMFQEERAGTAVKFLSDGLDMFSSKYPFMLVGADGLLGGMQSPRKQRRRTTSGGYGYEPRLMRTQSGLHTLTYPNEIIEDFLYLGNMWQATSENVLKSLRISHVINASLDCGNPFESMGVKYLNVSIKDDPSADLTVFFEQVYQFIHMARSDPHGRVLIHCTQGISRSGTLTIFYVMQLMQLSLVTAFNYVVARRGVVYPNMGFMHQLMKAEYRLYSANSLHEEEIDNLLAGMIPNRDRPGKIRKNATAFDETPSCVLCGKAFQLIVRARRQCKLCGRIVCARCSSVRLQPTPQQRARLGKTSVRSCDYCISRMAHIDVALDTHTFTENSEMQPRNHVMLSRGEHDKNVVHLSWPMSMPSSTVKGIIRKRFGFDRSSSLLLIKPSNERVSFGSRRVLDRLHIYVNPERRSRGSLDAFSWDVDVAVAS